MDQNPRKIVYSYVVGDLFHYGHLFSLQFSKSNGDIHICGVLTDKAVEEYRVKPIANFDERYAVIASLNCVDQVIKQESLDPTDNLKKIHEQFPNAQIILVHGANWKIVPGADYVQSIGGKLIQHPYYSRLSTLKIINYILENKDKFKDLKGFTSLIHSNEKNLTNKTIISTKADTLKSLQSLLTKSKIEPMYIFTFSDWKNNHQNILAQLQEKFPNMKIVIRSSAINEDTLESSLAGCFESILNINSNNSEEIENAITQVFNSYKNKNAESSFNQILVQKQTEHILCSGVLFTKSLVTNAPYYIINYDNTTGSTDSVTAGIEHQNISIAKNTDRSTIPKQFQKLIEAVQELETLIPSIPLDIEFAITKKDTLSTQSSTQNNQEEIIIFQVRPLAANMYKENHDQDIFETIKSMQQQFAEFSKKNHLAGNITIFGDMPDWNPAEIIGHKPNHLDYSLYDYVITNQAWHKARSSQGYYDVNPAKLVEIFANKPYVNVRNTFNSFTPAALDHQLREKLVNFYIEKLRANPHLQDKIEFEIVYTCYDLTLPKRILELHSHGFDQDEINQILTSIKNLTNNLLQNSEKNIEKDLQTVFSMENTRNQIKKEQTKDQSPSPHKLLSDSKILLEECTQKGTIQFSRLARLGFIGKIMLKSLVKENLITQETYDAFYNSIETVASDINNDFNALLQEKISKQEFLKKYGHLRPGTYDITSQRYENNPQLLKTANLKIEQKKKQTYFITKEQEETITNVLLSHNISITSTQFLTFAEQATKARELSKFEFTKNLSDALEYIAKAGEDLGFTRKEIAMLNIHDILHVPSQDRIKIWKEKIKEQENKKMITDKIILPSIILTEKDFEIIQHYDSRPNYITQKNITAEIIHLKNIEEQHHKIEGNIVILENGDPGYDWIFTRNPAGLITKYGGVASHMSIRCAEFGIPAAIGCGEKIFNQLQTSSQIILNCKDNKIIIL